MEYNNGDLKVVLTAFMPFSLAPSTWELKLHTIGNGM
jgi:hypothetical protein